MHNFFHGYQSMRRDINGSVTFVVINDPFIRKVLEYTNNESLSLAEKQIDISKNLVFIKSPRQWKNDCFHFSVKIHFLILNLWGEWVRWKTTHIDKRQIGWEMDMWNFSHNHEKQNLSKQTKDDKVFFSIMSQIYSRTNIK